MNRILEFRAWDTKKKQFLSHIPECEYMLDSKEWDHHDVDEMGGFYPDYAFDKYSFGGRIIFQQFIGLLDINSREIYEGDIVTCRFYMDWDDEREYEVIYLVKWCPIHVGFRGFTKEMVDQKYAGHGMPNPIKIIGNLFENPELLK